MKKILVLFFIALCFINCNEKNEISKLTIEGIVENYNTENLYLYEVTNQQYQYIKLLDTINVSEGKFIYVNDTLQTQLYFLSAYDNPQLEETYKQGSYLFLRKGLNKIKVYENDRKQMQADIEDFNLQHQYQEFENEKYIVSDQKLLDSLDQLFYVARDKDDREEMKRINEVSTPYYEKSDSTTRDWLKNEIEENKNSLFGLYLYYTYNFQNRSLSTLDEVTEVKARLENLDEDAKNSIYYTKIQNQLSLLENSMVGSKAPEITGLDSLDKEVKLSDFKGQYVLVDFWSSGCSWCRKETPYLQKTYDAFKDKNFTILGVSSDYKKEDWTEAIHEDKSYWNHIIMRKNEINGIMRNYVIVGIPEILLVDPEGVILAKGLRGDDIYNTVSAHVK